MEEETDNLVSQLGVWAEVPLGSIKWSSGLWSGSGEGRAQSPGAVLGDKDFLREEWEAGSGKVKDSLGGKEVGCLRWAEAA